MQSLCLNVEVLASDGSAIDMKRTPTTSTSGQPRLGIDLSRREPKRRKGLTDQRGQPSRKQF